MKEPIRLLTLCSGYDSQMLALNRLAKEYNLSVDLTGWSEINENAIKAHDAIFPEYADRNLGDMTKIDWNNVEDFDILTYSTPCTSISIQGRREGIAKGSGTASSILWSVEDCIKVKRPKILIMENVKALVSVKYKSYFKEWLDILESYGYTNFYQILNACDYGVAQSRERVFCISILDDTFFMFPQPVPLKKKIKDYLDKTVEPRLIYREKYLQNYHKYDKEKSASLGNGLILVGNVFNSDYASGRVYSAEGVAPTMVCNGGTGMLIEAINEEGKSYIRKLSPREMFRLMGVDDENIEKMYSAVKHTQALKLLAGNSIVTDCLYYIFKQLLIS